MALTEARYWGHHRIVWVGPKECPQPLAALARDLGETREFAAHITLLRKARAPKRLPDLPALEWPVAEFALVDSRLGPEGPSYEVLERYALVLACPGRGASRRLARPMAPWMSLAKASACASLAFAMLRSVSLMFIASMRA
jgi:hypothetical protein